MPFDGTKTNDRVVDTLQRTLTFYGSDPHNWTKCVGERKDPDGRIRRCLINAVRRMASGEFLLQNDTIQVLSNVLGYNPRLGPLNAIDNVITFNDTHTFPEVIALINKAIASR